MKSNVGGIDKIVRILAGVGLLAFFAIGEGTTRYWGLVGIVPLATGLFNFCPLYSLIGVNTCPARR
jgi:hypothetical protein